MFMGTSCVVLSIKNIKTRASRANFDINGGNVAKYRNVAGRGIISDCLVLKHMDQIIKGVFQITVIYMF